MTKSAHISQTLKRQKEAREAAEEAERSGTRPKHIINLFDNQERKEKGQIGQKG